LIQQFVLAIAQAIMTLVNDVSIASLDIGVSFAVPAQIAIHQQEDNAPMVSWVMELVFVNLVGLISIA
jgi:hypothetical protein